MTHRPSTTLYNLIYPHLPPRDTPALDIYIYLYTWYVIHDTWWWWYTLILIPVIQRHTGLRHWNVWCTTLEWSIDTPASDNVIKPLITISHPKTHRPPTMSYTLILPPVIPRHTGLRSFHKPSYYLLPPKDTPALDVNIYLHIITCRWKTHRPSTFIYTFI